MTENKVPVLLVCGVSGSGKTTIGTGLAQRLGWAYAEADAFHPTVNVEKMASGVPLTDEDRVPWLKAIGGFIDEATELGRSAVVTCSALKRAYRDELRSGRPNVRFVFLDAPHDVVSARLARRAGHFFPAELLASQYRDLEAPAPEENILDVPISAADTANEVVARILALLAR
ncbi:MAG TPA: gluconokinase [Actinospica sp.]|nr:gluconokinase [Actinospica sp.]